MKYSSKLRWLLIVTLTYWIALFTATHIPGPDLPEIDVSDKVIHFSAYALLAIVVLLSLNLLWPARRWNQSLTLVVLLTYGGFDETTQPFFHRACDIRDWLADAAGVASAVGVVGLLWEIMRSRRSKSVPVPDLETSSSA